RINGLTTPWGLDDLKAAAAAGPDAILVPKVDSGEDIAAIEALLAEAQAAPDINIWAMMETPRSVLDPLGIAAASQEFGKRLSCFVMGTNDIAKEMRMRHMPGRANMLGYLANSVAAARAFDLDVIDGVYNNFKDMEGFDAECTQGRDLGMDGKTLIHPSQVGPCNLAFSPSEVEVEDARAVIDAFALPENQGKAAISLNGRMVELLHAEVAKRVVALADAIAERDAAG
ncbi:MAG: HpcH/HpaI aldolase/citrate lyase family protein, partial [Magnetospiraceae bacterium]